MDQEAKDLDTVRALAKRHGWAVRVLTRRDAADCEDIEPLTDEEWAKLSSSRAWRDVCDMTDGDWQRISDAVRGTLGNLAERDERIQAEREALAALHPRDRQELSIPEPDEVEGVKGGQGNAAETLVTAGSVIVRTVALLLAATVAGALLFGIWHTLREWLTR